MTGKEYIFEVLFFKTEVPGGCYFATKQRLQFYKQSTKHAEILKYEEIYLLLTVTTIM